MALIRSKPTSQGRRFRVKVSNPELHKGKPCESLIAKLSKTGGRNNKGRITTRHIGGGHKRSYRIIDFKRDKDNIAAKVERLSMIQTEMLTLLFCCTLMEKEDT